MIIKKDYGNYKNITRGEIAQIEQYVRWHLGGDFYEKSFQILEFLDNTFPDINFLVTPSIDNGVKKIFVMKV